MKFTASDRWYQMTRTFLRDNRDWSGVSHLTVVKTVMQEAGVDTTNMDLPPDTPQYNQVLGIAGPADLTNMELDGRTNGPWQPRPSETAASFVERIARHFSNYIVGFHGTGEAFYIPRYYYTASELTLYESKTAATAAGSPNAPLFRRHMFTTILPEAIIVLVKAINVQTGAPRYSSLWVDWAAIKNKMVVNFLGWPKTEVVTIWGSYSCRGINWAARKIYEQTRRRFIRVKFECDYDPLIKRGALYHSAQLWPLPGAELSDPSHQVDDLAEPDVSRRRICGARLWPAPDGSRSDDPESNRITPMPDPGAEIRHLIENLVQQQLDAAAAQRGWDLGGQAQAAQLSVTGAGTADPYEAIEFSTGFDGTETTMGFQFDLSPFDGPDVLL